MITPGIILAALAGLGILFYLGNFIEATPEIIETVMLPFSLSVERFFSILGYLAPLLVSVVPLYLVLRSDVDVPAQDRNRLVLYASLYGLALYGVAVFSGLDTLLMQAMRGSWMVGSTIGTAVSFLGAAAEWVIGVLMGMVLWGAGLLLAVLDGVLSALVGIGEAARYGRKGVSRAQRGILDRLGGS
jgi:hypothetical protein